MNCSRGCQVFHLEPDLVSFAEFSNLYIRKSINPSFFTGINILLQKHFKCIVCFQKKCIFTESCSKTFDIFFYSLL